MKLKSHPEDFQVDEQTTVRPTNGPYALYRLTKRGMGTPEAISEILRNWNLPRNRISYGGLKDRHASTTQYVSIAHGPKQGMSDRSFTLDYLGQIPNPFGAKDISGNRFAIRLRGISSDRKSELDRRLQNAAKFGVLNYFDDQRFGSIGFSGELIGRYWCKGDYERALFLALAEANMHDRPREKEQKELLRDYWGQWDKCKAMLDRSHRRSVVTYLVDHPTDFKRAVALIRQDLRGIYVAAFQSWIWNRWLSALIDRFNGDVERRTLESRCGPLSLPRWETPDALERWHEFASRPLPLPSARQHDWPEGTLEVLEPILQGLDMSIREVRLKFPRDTFFSKGNREIVLRARGLTGTWCADDTKPEKSDWLLAFELPRGSYATMIIRQLMNDSNDLEWETDDEESV